MCLPCSHIMESFPFNVVYATSVYVSACLPNTDPALEGNVIWYFRKLMSQNYANVMNT